MKKRNFFLDYCKLIPTLLKRPAVSEAYPVHLQLETTNACNLDCRMCWHSDLIKDPKILTFSDFKKILEEVRPQKVNLSGLGEPLLNKDIFRMISCAKAQGLSVTIATNFTLAQDKVEELFASGIDLVKISIDAAKKDTYKKIRRADYFEGILRSIHKLNTLKNKFGSKKPHLRFNFAIQNENINEITSLVGLAKNYSVESIYIQYLKFYDHEEKRDLIVGQLAPDNLFKVIVEARKIARREGISTNIPIWLKNFDLFYNRFEKEQLESVNKRRCYSPWFEVFVEANGDVRPCPVFAWRRNEGVMGNILNGGFGQIWNSPRYVNFRDELKAGNRPCDICKGCLPFTLGEFFGIFSHTLPGFNKLKGG